VYSVLATQSTNVAATVNELSHSNQQAVVNAAGDDGAGSMNDNVTGTSVVECDSFCDFIRFEGTVTEHSVPAKKSTSDAGSAALLRTCIEKYKLLFAALVAERILQHNQSLSASFMDQFVSSEALSTSYNTSETARKNVSRALVRCLDRVELAGLTKIMVESFTLACQLLVDFSALPIYTESAMFSPAENVAGKK